MQGAFYQTSSSIVTHGCAWPRYLPINSPFRLSFVLQLGDLIDGRNAPGGSEAALARTKGELARLEKKLALGVLNSLGNHELYNFPKERWAREVR